jgi:hypothetical protein
VIYEDIPREYFQCLPDEIQLTLVQQYLLVDGKDEGEESDVEDENPLSQAQTDDEDEDADVEDNIARRYALLRSGEVSQPYARPRSIGNGIRPALL